MTTWYLRRHGGARISLSIGGYDKHLDADLKSTLPGPIRYDTNRSMWLFPLMWEVCVGLRPLADKRHATLEIGPRLASWARRERNRVRSIPDVESVEPQELPRLAREQPKTHKQLRPFQTVGAKFIATNRHALIADEPGLGKTAQTIAGIIEAGTTGPILVIGPKAAVRLTWPGQIRRWSTRSDRVTVIGPENPPDERKALLHQAVEAGTPGKRSWVLVSPNYIRQRRQVDGRNKQVMSKGKPVVDNVREAIPEILEVTWSAIIVDESHQTLAGASSVIKKQSAQRQGLGALKLKREGLRIALSGTPFRGKKEHLWGQLNWIRPDIYRSTGPNAYWKWIARHFHLESDGWDDRIVGDIQSEEKFYAEARKVMLRRTKAEVAPELPPKLYGGTHLDPDDEESPIAVWLPITGKQKRQYDSMVKNAIAQIKGGTLMANGTFSEKTRLRQLACACGQLIDEDFHFSLPSNKFDWLLEFLDELGPGHPKVIVSSKFTKLLECFSDGLAKHKIESFLFTGNVTDKQRAFVENDWQNNQDSSVRVMLLNMDAGGTSLTLDAADYVVTLDEPFNREDEEQVENRTHRLSRLDHNVTVYRLRSLETYEEHVARNTTKKDIDIHALMDGPRGIEFTMKLLGQ